MPDLIALQIELPSSNLPWLFAAFAVSWAVFFLYVIYVTRRQQEMQNQIRQLRRAMEQQETPEGD
ncbi:MAG: hypothetical protein BZY81_08755 [SAR202 cluster bacterium Io17-Chloro-G4]|nr:MAG: hypothetical protein BZY81_08755 [SAR202 cluster bacterium Io17-Chloro-G4]